MSEEQTVDLAAPSEQVHTVEVQPPSSGDVPATVKGFVRGIFELQTGLLGVRNTSPWISYEIYRARPDRLRLQFCVPNTRLERKVRTQLVFDPSGSEDLSKLSRMLRGIDRDQLTALGDYQAVVQKPGTRTRNTATIVDTYPPWTSDDTDIDRLKTAGTAATEPAPPPQKPVLGKGMNAGGETHTELLSTAKDHLEERGLHIDLLYQDAGDDKPDGHVHLPTGEIAHLEAEHGTLSKPAKILTNLARAAREDRQTVFVVAEGNAEKLRHIVTNPVNRTKTDDATDPPTYYQTDDGPFTALDEITDVEYRILEVDDDDLQVVETADPPTCPELEHCDRADLETFCTFRTADGHCLELAHPCVLTD